MTEKHYLCQCGGVLSQIHPGYPTARCVKCKTLTAIPEPDQGAIVMSLTSEQAHWLHFCLVASATSMPADAEARQHCIDILSALEQAREAAEGNHD